MTRQEYERVQKKKRKERKRKNKKKLRLYALSVIFLAIAIIALVVMLLFRIQKIEIDGNQYCTDKEIREMVQDDKYSTNSLYVIGKYLTGHGKTYPCFERVKVSMGAPWILKVSVQEKPIIGYTEGKEDYLYFDQDGMIVKKDNQIMEGIPFVEGLDTDHEELYQPLKKEKSDIFEEILETSQELKKYDMNIKKIVCKNDRIYVYINKVCVSLGNQVSAEKIAQISPIMEKLGNKKGTLHLENYSEERKTITFNKGKFPKEN